MWAYMKHRTSDCKPSLTITAIAQSTCMTIYVNDYSQHDLQNKKSHHRQTARCSVSNTTELYKGLALDTKQVTSEE